MVYIRYSSFNTAKENVKTIIEKIHAQNYEEGANRQTKAVETYVVQGAIAYSNDFWQSFEISTCKRMKVDPCNTKN